MHICSTLQKGLGKHRRHVGRQTDLNQKCFFLCASNYKYFIKNLEKSVEARFSHLLAQERKAMYADQTRLRTIKPLHSKHLTSLDIYSAGIEKPCTSIHWLWLETTYTCFEMESSLKLIGQSYFHTLFTPIFSQIIQQN